MARSRGFTLIELIGVIVILGILIVTAANEFFDLRRDARVALVENMRGNVEVARNLAHQACLVSTACDTTAWPWVGTILGQTCQLVEGYPDAGEDTGGSPCRIEHLVKFGGFTVVWNNGGLSSNFRLDHAPDPATCAVVYTHPAAPGTGIPPTVTSVLSGC